MGDYTKLIVNCGLKKMNEAEIDILKDEITDRLSLCSSAYHCGGELLHLDNDWHHRTDLSFITQAKWGDGIDEFIDWLRPQVVDGFGEEDAFAMAFSEYQKEPTMYYAQQLED